MERKGEVLTSEWKEKEGRGREKRKKKINKQTRRNRYKKLLIDENGNEN